MKKITFFSLIACLIFMNEKNSNKITNAEKKKLKQGATEKDWFLFNGSSRDSRVHLKKAVKVVTAHSITTAIQRRLFSCCLYVRIFTKLAEKQVVKEIDVNKSVSVPSGEL